MTPETQRFEQGESIFTPEFRAKLNTVAEQAASANRINVGPGLVITQTPGNGVSLALDLPPSKSGFERLFAVLTDSSGGWEERVLDDAGDWVAPADPLSSVDEGPASELNGRTGVPAGTMVELFPLIDGDGDAAYWFDLGAGTGLDENGDPLPRYDLDPADFGSEDEDAKEWDITSQGEEHRGFQLSVTTRVVYDAAGLQILFRFKRLLSFDANGHCVSVSAEVRQEVETPADCAEEVAP